MALRSAPFAACDPVEGSANENAGGIRLRGNFGRNRGYEKASQSMHDWGQPDTIKDIISKRIIELASKGERDPDRLCEQALKSFGFSESPRL